MPSGIFHIDTHIDLAQECPESLAEGEFKSPLTKTQVLAAFAVSVGSMIVGYCSAWSSPAIASMNEPDSGIEITPDMASWIGSLMPLSALAGGFVGGSLLTVFGRKRTILATAPPFILASLLVVFANEVSGGTVYMIYTGRAITGFCIGIISLSLPVYLAEAIHPDVRGTLGLLPTSLGNGGVMLCYICGFFFDWQILSLIGGIIPVPFLLLMWIIPETPRHLYNKGKTGEAKAALQWLRGPEADISMEVYEMERAQKRLDKKFEARELLQKGHVKALAISMGLMFFQQLSGINAVMFYSVSIFTEAGSSINSNLATIILGIVNICATIMSNLLIDRLGRKILLYISDIGMICSLAVFGGYFYMKEEVEEAEAPGWLPLVALMVYVVSFSIGFGPIPWLMMGEIFPSRIRGAAASISTAFNWSCTFVVTKTYHDLQSSLGPHGAFWLFASILVVSLFFVFFFVPETQGKTLDDIERLYREATEASMGTNAAAAAAASNDEAGVMIKARRPSYRKVSSMANLKPTPSIIL